MAKAKKVPGKKKTEQQQGSGGERRAVKAIGKNDLLALVRSANATNSKIAEERGALGAKVAYAVENKNLHKAAFGVACRLQRMDPMKLAEWLFNFDVYRQYLELDAIKAADMLPDRAEPDEDGDEDVRPAHLRQREADREAAGDPEPAVEEARPTVN